MLRVVEQQITAYFTPGNLPARFPPPIEAQIVTGIMIQLLGWWLENNTGYSAAGMAEMVRDVLKYGTRSS
jgi:hypothetical protein